MTSLSISSSNRMSSWASLSSVSPHSFSIFLQGTANQNTENQVITNEDVEVDKVGRDNQDRAQPGARPITKVQNWVAANEDGEAEVVGGVNQKRAQPGHSQWGRELNQRSERGKPLYVLLYLLMVP